MKVYKITFPGNEFYIGYTKFTLQTRMNGHINAICSKGMATMINKYQLSVGDLVSMSEIIYEGWDADYKERVCIFEERDNELMINKRIPKIHPSYEDWQDIRWFKESVNIPNKETFLKLEFMCFKNGMKMNEYLTSLANKEYETYDKGAFK